MILYYYASNCIIGILTKIMALKQAILAILHEQELTGYDIAKKFSGSVAHFWAASHQQIYQELKIMTRDKWVMFKHIEQKDRPAKKIYHITATGLQALKDWLKKPATACVIKDALLIKLFVGHLEQPQILAQDIQRLKQSHQTQLDAYLKLEKECFLAQKNLPLPLRFQYLTLRQGILIEKAWCQWAEETLTLLATITQD